MLWSKFEILTIILLKFLYYTSKILLKIKLVQQYNASALTKHSFLDIAMDTTLVHLSLYNTNPYPSLLFILSS